MSDINSIFLSDSYKMAHPRMLPKGTTLMYGNCTPRSGKHAPKECKKVVSIGQQLLVRWLVEDFDKNFFSNPDAVREIQSELSMHYGTPYDASHFQQLHDLGYLPLKFKSLPEGVEVPFGVPLMTWYNTHPDFAWLPLCLETPLSTQYWKIPTSATIALAYKRILTKWAKKTNPAEIDFVDFQGHDFSARGLAGSDATWLSGIGHAAVFMGSDTLAVIPAARKYYDEDGFIIGSVPASEHSVSSACIAVMGELEMIRYYMEQFPKGIMSIVSDTLDLWKVITEMLPVLKEEILTRDGKVVIRPDSGDPVDIICGRAYGYNPSDDYETEIPEIKGVIELLWDIFGGTVNEQGYKVLDSHIGAIYGDSITIDRAEEICKRLEAKGFASTNIVLGVGSFTYQYNTRDTFGFAMKATYVEIAEHCNSSKEICNLECDTEGERVCKGQCQHPVSKGRAIFKDPITDDGTKKSAKGLLCVGGDGIDEDYALIDEGTWDKESKGALQTILEDGKFSNVTTLTEIREILN